MGEDMLQSALLGAAIGVAVVLVMALIGSRRKPHFDAPPKRHQTVSSPLAPAEALQRVKALAGTNKLALAAEEPAKNLVVLSDSLSWASFGSFYPVFAKATPGGSELIVGISPRTPQFGPAVSMRLRKIVDAVRAAVG
ncbi:MAG TPA: hypothetical protein VJL84_03050 [Kiloniellales bacterium]|nr:hypothetical protein [Kiloniellales bacterium]